MDLYIFHLNHFHEINVHHLNELQYYQHSNQHVYFLDMFLFPSQATNSVALASATSATYKYFFIFYSVLNHSYFGHCKFDF